MIRHLLSPRAPAALAALAALAACTTPASPDPSASQAPAPAVAIAAAAPATTSTASAPRAPTRADPAGGGAATRPAPARERVAALPWGKGKAALGMTMAAEQNPTAPMAIAGDSAGRLWILDQDNERVVRLGADGAALDHELPVALRWPQDLALVERGAAGARSVDAVLVLDRLAEAAVAALDARDGRERFRYTLRGDAGVAYDPDAPAGPTGIAFGGGVTGVFVHDGGVWAEWAHERGHLLGDLAGLATPSERRIAGRPAPGLGLGLTAMRAGDEVYVHGRTLGASNAERLAPSWTAKATMSMPVFALRALDADPFGRVWVAVNTVREDAGGQIAAEGLEVVRFGRDGAVELRDTATLELGPHEQQRTFAVGAEGTYWHLARRDDGAVIERWRP